MLFRSNLYLLQTGDSRRLGRAMEQEGDELEGELGSGPDDEVSSQASSGLDTGTGSVMASLHKAFISPTKENISNALSRLPKITYAPPSHITYQEALDRGLLPMQGDDVYSQYNVTERMFLSMSTDRNWTQNEAREVLEVLLDPRFRIEDLGADVLRRVSIHLFIPPLFHCYSTVITLLFP